MRSQTCRSVGCFRDVDSGASHSTGGGGLTNIIRIARLDGHPYLSSGLQRRKLPSAAVTLSSSVYAPSYDPIVGQHSSPCQPLPPYPRTGHHGCSRRPTHFSAPGQPQTSLAGSPGEIIKSLDLLSLWPVNCVVHLAVQLAPDPHSLSGPSPFGLVQESRWDRICSARFIS